MPRITFDCEGLTPIFLAGARRAGAQQQAELRGASLRGALRYWYRVLLGGRGIAEQDQLKEKEAAVFGSTDQASPVRVRLLPYDIGDTGQNKASGIDNLDRSNTGTRYLWYFAHPTLTNKDKYDPAEDRRYIAPGDRFEVQLLARRGQEEALREAARAFWLLVHLGGLGLRSRRMAGAFDAEIVGSTDGIDLPSFEAPNGYDDWFAEQLRQFGVGASVPERPPFDTLSARHSGAWRLGTPRQGWDDLVETIGTKFKEHREELDVPEKVGLGLPMVTPPGTPPIDVTQGREEVDRRASPLWLQVVRGPDGRLDAVATFMQSQFASGGDRVRVSWEGGEDPVRDPYGKLGTFHRDDDFSPASLLPAQQ